MSRTTMTAAIRAAVDQGRKALIPYLPAGFPNKDRFWNELAALSAGGADVIEIGVPFSDPVADGPTVEQACLECLECGITLEWILAEMKARRSELTSHYVLMGYMNPFLQYGLDRLAEDAAEAGVSGFIVPDLPFEEAAAFKQAIEPKDMALIPLIGLNTSAERMQLYAQDAKGFAYFVSVLGITGVRDSLPDEIVEKIAAAKAAFDVPLAVGFGIKTPEQVTAFGDSIDAVVFGSALINHLREGGDCAGFMERWT